MSHLAIELLLGLVGAGGIAGAIATFVKLGPDVNSAAVTQSQGAMQTMKELNDSLVNERDYWRQRAIDAETALSAASR